MQVASERVYYLLNFETLELKSKKVEKFLEYLLYMWNCHSIYLKLWLIFELSFSSFELLFMLEPSFYFVRTVFFFTCFFLFKLSFYFVETDIYVWKVITFCSNCYFCSNCHFSVQTVIYDQTVLSVWTVTINITFTQHSNMKYNI